MTTQKFPAQLAYMDEAIDFVNAQLEENDCPMKTLLQIDIAVEEIFVNIARYAYEGAQGEAEIGVGIEDDPRCAVIRFADRGVPYDPLSREEPDVTLGVEEREIGGLGILMVKKSMDDVVYAYEDGQNILTLRKRL